MVVFRTPHSIRTDRPEFPALRIAQVKAFTQWVFARGVAEVLFPRAIAFWFFALSFLGGILFYVTWGFTYGSWNLFRPEWVGAYAVTVVLLGFGSVGMLLYRKEVPTAKP